MKNTGYHPKNRRLQYQIAGTVLVVACIGFALLYFWQKYEARQDALRQAELEEQAQQELAEKEKEEEEESKIASAVIEPKQQVTEEQPQDAQEPAESQTQQTQQAAPTAAEDLHFNGELVWPVEGEVLISYSMDKTVYFPTLQQYKYNPAMIIAGNVNDKVTSAARGKITSIETNSQTGCTVTVDLGDGYQAIYGQLKEVPLATGDVVEAGTTIGYISEPTKYYSVEGSNLYFALKKDGESKNPLEFMKDTAAEE